MPQREYRVIESVELWADGCRVGTFNIFELASHAAGLYEQKKLAEDQATEQSRRICDALNLTRGMEKPSSVIREVIRILEGE